MSGQLPAGGKLHPPVSRAGILHMGMSGSVAPVRGKILFPKFKEIARLAKEHAESAKHWCEGFDSQCDMDVGNVGKDFRKVVEYAFGEGRVRRILFPAVYVGRVAKEISNAGFEVVCTDVQRMWVENARKLGMEAHIGSAEEFPPGRFDIVACFEPYPLYDNPLALPFALRVMAETGGFVQVQSVPHRYFSGLSAVNRYVAWSGPARIILAYGSSGKSWENDLWYSAVLTTPGRKGRAAMDLEMLGALEGVERASVAGLAKRLGREIGKIEDSLVRIIGIVDKVCDYKTLKSFIRSDAGEKGVMLAFATGMPSLNDFGKPVGGLSHRDFVQEIEITD